MVACFEFVSKCDNGSSERRLMSLEHSVHCEVANVRLRPCLHLPHKSPDLLCLHCLSVSLKVNLTLPDLQ